MQFASKREDSEAQRERTNVLLTDPPRRQTETKRERERDRGERVVKAKFLH